MNQFPSPVLASQKEVVAHIRATVPSLRPAEARVARAILDDPEAIIYSTVSDAAAAAETSASTVVRACQELGFRGFQALKIALAREAVPPLEQIRGDVAADDSPADVLRKVVAASAEAVQHAAVTVDASQFADVVAALAGADRILIIGIGTSAPIAQDAAYRLTTIGLRAEAPPDAHVQHVVAQLLAPGDVCLAVSHTGSTQETLAAFRAAAAAGATAIALTSFVRSPITELADLVLVAGSREITFRVEAVASRLAHLAVLDALLVAVALTTGQRAAEILDLTEQAIAEHRL